ncbi:hypothetical protein TNCV_2013351 [Trichonephila clavipes]|nr:hypothetical protein TNCV_2013351 [Trichonephila clavipes]
MTPFELLFGTKMKSCQDIEIVELLNDEILAQFQEQRDALRQDAKKTAMADSDVDQSGCPIFDDIFQHLWPYIGNNRRMLSSKWSSVCGLSA